MTDEKKPEQKMKQLDPLKHEYLGEIKLGFFRHKDDNRMILTIRPIPVDTEDKAAMTTMALYTAGIRESIKVINQNIEQAQLIQKLRGMTNDDKTTVPEGKEKE